MTEEARTTLFGILKLIPFAIVTVLIALPWIENNPDFFLFLFFFFWWVIIPVFICTVVFFFMSIRCRDKWELATVIWGAVNVLLIAVFFLTRPTVERCDPDIMAANYEEHRTEMEELREYIHESLNDSCVIKLFFVGDQLESFYVGKRYGCDNYYKGEAQSHLDSMMVIAGLSQEEFTSVKQRLESMQCNGVEYDQYDSTWIFIRFRCDKWGCYGYSIQTRPKTNKQKEAIMKDNRFIPYDEYCSFVYDGSAGAFDSGGFDGSEKRRFLKKHKPW